MPPLVEAVSGHGLGSGILEGPAPERPGEAAPRCGRQSPRCILQPRVPGVFWPQDLVIVTVVPREVGGRVGVKSKDPESAGRRGDWAGGQAWHCTEQGRGTGAGFGHLGTSNTKGLWLTLAREECRGRRRISSHRQGKMQRPGLGQAGNKVTLMGTAGWFGKDWGCRSDRDSDGVGGGHGVGAGKGAAKRPQREEQGQRGGRWRLPFGLR